MTPQVPTWWRPYVQRFVQLAYPPGQDLEVDITSWGRTRSHNAQVGGQPESQHLVWTAWDVAGPHQGVYAARCRARGLTVIDEGDHVHVQLFRAGVVPSAIIDAIARA